MLAIPLGLKLHVIYMLLTTYGVVVVVVVVVVTIMLHQRMQE
jgi:hypothetical protein